MSPDDALRLFNEEIASCEGRIKEKRQGMLDWRLKALSMPLMAYKKIEELRIHIMCEDELLRVLVKSRDHLLEEMMKEAI